MADALLNLNLLAFEIQIGARIGEIGGCLATA
jgi:hypothetical protein